MKKGLITLIGMTFAIGMAVPAAAQSYTSPDGILSIELPGDGWEQLEDHTKWIALSNGSDLITIEHFANGDKLPEIKVADEAYADTVTSALATRNEVFIATGSITNQDDVNKIDDALKSIKILKYDTMTPAGTAAPAAAPAAPAGAAPSSFSISPRDMIMYVTASSDALNVRAGYTVDTPVIGGLGYGTPVKVTGAVLKDGADYGWYQIAFKNGTGFVAGNYLSSTPPEGAAIDPATPWYWVYTYVDPDDIDFYIVYAQDTGLPIYLIGDDGVYYDYSGDVYYYVGGGNFVNTTNVYYSVTVPQSAPDTLILGVVSEDTGRPAAIVEEPDGTFKDGNGNTYKAQDDGTYVNQEGTVYQVKSSSDTPVDISSIDANDAEDPAEAVDPDVPVDVDAPDADDADDADDVLEPAADDSDDVYDDGDVDAADDSYDADDADDSYDADDSDSGDDSFDDSSYDADDAYNADDSDE